MVDARKALEDELLALQKTFSSCEESGDMPGMARARAKIKKVSERLQQATGGDATEIDASAVTASKVSATETAPPPVIEPVSPEAVAEPSVEEAAVLAPVVAPVELEAPSFDSEYSPSEMEAAPRSLAPTAAGVSADDSLASLLVRSLESTPVYVDNEQESAQDEGLHSYVDENYLALMGQKLTALTELDEREREVQAQSLINELIDLAQLERSAGVKSVSDNQSLRKAFQQFNEGRSLTGPASGAGYDDMVLRSSTREGSAFRSSNGQAQEFAQSFDAMGSGISEALGRTDSPSDGYGESILPAWVEPERLAEDEVQGEQANEGLDEFVSEAKVDRLPVPPAATERVPAREPDQIISASVKEQAARVLVDLVAGKETLAQMKRDAQSRPGDEEAESAQIGAERDLKKELGKFWKFLTSPEKFISALDEEKKRKDE